MSVRFRTTQDLAGDRRDLAEPEQQEAQQVRDGVAFGPLEVQVRDDAGGVAHVQRQAASAFGTDDDEKVSPR